jgi:hypothetical protein
MSRKTGRHTLSDEIARRRANAKAPHTFRYRGVDGQMYTVTVDANGKGSWKRDSAPFVRGPSAVSAAPAMLAALPKSNVVPLKTVAPSTTAPRPVAVFVPVAGADLDIKELFDA